MSRARGKARQMGSRLCQVQERIVLQQGSTFSKILTQGLQALSKMPGTRCTSHLGVFWIREFLHRLNWFNILNTNIQNMKCSEIRSFMSINAVRAQSISDFGFGD
jgi:hypothetical protein